MRTLVAAVLTATVSLAGAGSATAGRPPVHERATFDVREALPAAVCGFDVDLRVQGRTFTRFYLDGDGELKRAISTGPIRITFQRRDTNAVATYAISGPSFFDARGRLVRGTGRWFTFTAYGTPAIAIGNLTFDGDGVPEDPAKVVDVCRVLA